MTTSDDYAIGEAQWPAFGAIIQGFARCEYLMTIIVASLTKTDLFHTMIMMSELGYAGKRNTTRCIIDSSSLDSTTKERLKCFLGEIHKHNSLRNNVAHNIWKDGSRPDSIKPFGVTIRRGKIEVTGMDPTDPDMTTDELNGYANNLTDTYDHLRDYLIEVGLMPDIEK